MRSSFIAVAAVALASGACATSSNVRQAEHPSAPAEARADSDAAEHEHHAGNAPEQLGTVAFSNSCAPAVQAKFTRAVALLHSFWWTEGEKTFRAVLADDPSCAIATWGLAAVLINNPFGPGPTPEAAEKAQAALRQGRAIGAKTQRERDYIEAIAAYYEDFANRPQVARFKNLSAAFSSLAEKYPDDDEAKIFSALYLAATQDPKDKTFATTLRAASILEPLFVKYPNHPGIAHYLIHSYDYPPLAEKGLAAARRYAGIAPSAPHALHMPSHIFTRVGAWTDSVETNRKSYAVAKAGHELQDQLHAMDYIVYADLQLARDDDARALAAEARSIRSYDTSRNAAAFAEAAMPARLALERGAWSEAAQLEPVRDAKFSYTEAMTWYARALGAARSGDVSGAEADVRELARIHQSLEAAKNAYWAREVEAQLLAAQAWTSLAGGKNDEAVALMQSSARIEDGSEKNAVTPGRLLPAHELLGEMLLQLDRPAEALAEFERSDTRDPHRFRTVSGAALAASRAGDSAKATRYYSQLVDMAGAGTARPELGEARAWLARR
jgi:tetratricopeptide (TPR) repeat protein